MNRILATSIFVPLFLLLSLNCIPFLTGVNTIATQIESTNQLQNQLDSYLKDATVSLSASTYTQQITITTPLAISGTPNRTFFNVTSPANSYAIHVATSFVTLTDLIIENHGSGLYTTGIKITADNVLIRNCTIKNTPVGVAIWADYVTIEDCVFENCEDEGIALLGSSMRIVQNTVIRNCTFINNCDGIELQNAFNTTIQNCYFINQTHAAIDAIGRNNAYIVIDSCEIEKSKVYDIYLANSQYTTISETQFIDDKLFQFRSTNTTIKSDVPATVNKSISPLKLRFSTQQYLQNLLERYHEYVSKWYAKIEEFKTTIYNKI
jgi:hypothetical protein